jgi:hypothetical protein
VSIVHIRDIAKYGVLCDPDPYNLPDTAWSFGVNVRFRNGKVSSGPVFRNVFPLGTVSPRYSVAASPVTGLDLLFTGYLNGKIYKFNGDETDYTLAGYTPSSAEGTWTTTSLANILYINRSDRSPWYLRASDTTFQNLGVVSGAPGSWDSTYSCQLLRTCGGALVALNVTKGATNFPTMVKTSSIPLSGVIPTSWDPSLPNTLATENILAEMKGSITDAQTLGPQLAIYGLQEAWLMTADGSQQVYSYRKLPFQKGALNANCSFELDGKHFVFGVDDIWMHDGNTEVSIVDEKNRDFIFSSINLSKRNRCFISHNPQLKELAFNYISGDRGVGFIGAPDGCNRAYVYNYSDKTGTFDDLPLVYSSASANLSVSVTYATTTALYSTTGGSYLDQEDGFKRTPVYVGDANATYGLSTSLYALDLFGTGSTVPFPVDTNATLPRILERDGIDLDSLNEDLRGYKVVSSIYPQGRFGSGAQPLMFSVGAADYFTTTPVFGAYQPYDGNTNYKLDFNIAGRWLSMRIKYSDYNEMTLTGFDIDLHANGQA